LIEERSIQVQMLSMAFVQIVPAVPPFSKKVSLTGTYPVSR